MPLNEMFLQTLLGRKLAHIISVPEYNFDKFGRDPMEGEKNPSLFQGEFISRFSGGRKSPRKSQEVNLPRMFVT